MGGGNLPLLGQPDGLAAAFLHDRRPRHPQRHHPVVAPAVDRDGFLRFPGVPVDHRDALARGREQPPPDGHAGPCGVLDHLPDLQVVRAEEVEALAVEERHVVRKICGDRSEGEGAVAVAGGSGNRHTPRFPAVGQIGDQFAVVEDGGRCLADGHETGPRTGQLHVREDLGAAGLLGGGFLEPEPGALPVRAHFRDREVFRALKQENLDLGTKLQLLTSYIKALYDDPTQHGRIQDLFAELIEQHPHEVDIHDLYSAYFAAIKDYASAAEQSKYAVDIDPSDESRWRSLMSMHGMCDNYDMAIAEGHNALNYHPKSLALTYYLAINYSMAEMTDSALVYYDKALALIEPNNSSARSDIYCSIGDTYYKANSADSAYVYYEKAIEANPGNLLALNNCAYHMACENRDLEKAERMSAMTVREEPQNSSSLDTYAWVLFKLKRYNDAKYYIDEAFKYDEEPSSELYHHAGDIYFFATGEAEQSLPFWQKALELEPDNELLQRKVKHQTYFSR